jgi:hypothetical protein
VPIATELTMPYIPSSKLAKWREANKPGRCPILNDRKSDWVVDHDHRTGMVRGVISRMGNSLLGKIENFLYRRCGQSPENFSSILRNIADYLDQESTDVLHPVGLTQLTKRFAYNLTAEEQCQVLRDLGADQRTLDSLTNSKQRESCFRKLTKQKHE